MKLAQRLLLGTLAVISVLVVFLVAIASGRLRERLYDQTESELAREASVVAVRWTSAARPDEFTDSLAAVLGHRVTLIDSAGHVVGDSDFDGRDLATLENHAGLPEILAARTHGTGRARRAAAAGDREELYVAARAPLGIARIGVDTRTVDRIVSGARDDVLIAGLVATVFALLLAWLFSRSVSGPVAELSGVARAIAAGDISRRPSLAAPGEIGDLAAALHRMAEQLAARLVALEEEDAFTSALVESLDEGVVAVDGRRDVVRLNSAARQLLAVRDTVPFSADLLSRDQVLRGALSDALSGRSTDAAELRLGERTALLTARPLLAGGAVLALLDLTAIRRLENVRRDFVANVSHELKTPLTVIVGFAETLADDDPPASQRHQFVEAIRSNALRMQRLVDDLLDLSRIESGHWQPNPTRVDIGAAIHDTITNVGPAARAKSIAIVTDIAPDAGVVVADQLAVRQVLANLAENAVRYTQAGSVTIFSHAAPLGVIIGVRDTGIGIPADHLQRVFERFYRVDPGRSRAAGGTGLGLAIVKHLVEAHGGKVVAESAPGNGTTVSAFFPAPES